MDKFKIGDVVRIAPPPGASSGWRPKHGPLPRGKGYGPIIEFGE